MSGIDLKNPKITDADRRRYKVKVDKSHDTMQAAWKYHKIKLQVTDVAAQSKGRVSAVGCVIKLDLSKRQQELLADDNYAVERFTDGILKDLSLGGNYGI